jgi:hypothetical protein
MAVERGRRFNGPPRSRGLLWATRRRFDPSSSPSATDARSGGRGFKGKEVEQCLRSEESPRRAGCCGAPVQNSITANSRRNLGHWTISYARSCSRVVASYGYFCFSSSQNAVPPSAFISSRIFSRGMTPQRLAQTLYCSAMSRTRSGYCAARSSVSVRSASMS